MQEENDRICNYFNYLSRVYFLRDHQVLETTVKNIAGQMKMENIR